MRLLFFVLTIFLPLAHASALSVHSLTSTGLPLSDTVPKSGASFGYGIPWAGVVYETVVTNGVVIQSGFPKGGPVTDSWGKQFGQTVFWSRVVNETDNPLELTITFPGDLFPIPPSPGFYFKLFLPQDTMALDKMFLYNYGVTGLESFVDNGLNLPTTLKKHIDPNGDCMFYIVALFQSTEISRAALVLKGEDLFYRISSMDPLLDAALIPCGKIVLKKSGE